MTDDREEIPPSEDARNEAATDLAEWEAQLAGENKRHAEHLRAVLVGMGLVKP